MVTSAPTHLHNGLYTFQYGRFEVIFGRRKLESRRMPADALSHHTHFAHSNRFGWWTVDCSQWHRQIEFIRDSDNDHISPFACLRACVCTYPIWLFDLIFVSASEFNRYQSMHRILCTISQPTGHGRWISLIDLKKKNIKWLAKCLIEYTTGDWPIYSAIAFD